MPCVCTNCWAQKGTHPRNEALQRAFCMLALESQGNTPQDVLTKIFWCRGLLAAAEMMLAYVPVLRLSSFQGLATLICI